MTKFTESEIEQALAKARPFITAKASSFQEDTEDLVQEGMLEAWKAIKSFEVETTKVEYLPHILTKIAYFRILSVGWRGQPHTSSEKHRHSLGRIKNRDVVYASDGYEDSDHSKLEYLSLKHETQLPSVEEEAMFTSVRSEVLEAIKKLPPSAQKFMILKFYHRYDTSAMFEAFGYHALSKFSRYKGKLQKDLEHLRGLVVDV